MYNPTTYTLPYFGQLDLNDLDDYYDVDIDFNGNSVQLDLNFDGDTPERDRFDAIKSFIDNLHEKDARNKEYMRSDYADAEADSVKFYFRFHMEEMGKEELADLIGVSDGLPTDQQLLDHLRMVRVGFYPSEENYFAICDYSFGRDITNYIVVIVLNEQGELVNITVES